MRGVPLRSLLTPRWAGLVVAVAVLVLACLRLGLWQWERYEQRDAAQTVVSANLAQGPAPVGEVLVPNRAVDDTTQWRTVTAVGSYDPARQILWRNRPFESRTGAHVLVPLVTAQGTALLVDRGWIPAAASAAQRLDVPAPPAGPVSVTARVRAGEQLADAEELGLADSPQRSVARLDPDLVVVALGAQPAYPGYAELVEERVAGGPVAGPAPQRVPPPSPSAAAVGEGANLSYALQWFCFAVIAVVGVVILARRELADLRAARAERLRAQVPANPPVRRA